MTAPKKNNLPYPPPWQDLPTLCEHISVSPNTIDTWVSQGILPPPRERGGKRLCGNGPRLTRSLQSAGGRIA
jgi:hypothetical protein